MVLICVFGGWFGLVGCMWVNEMLSGTPTVVRGPQVMVKTLSRQVRPTGPRYTIIKDGLLGSPLNWVRK